MATPSSIGPKFGYDIKDKINTKYDDALAAAAVRTTSTTSGFHVGKINRHTGGIYVGATHLISDCETTTTSATSRGVWSASSANVTCTAATTANRTGTNGILMTAAAGTTLGDYILFTCTTGYELDLTDMNFVGFWSEHDDTNNSFDADGDITVEMYDGTTKVYSYAVPAYVSATPHGKGFPASAVQTYIECPLTTSEIQTGYTLSNITSIRIVKGVTALVNTKIWTIDYFEAYEISAGGWPFRYGIIVPMTATAAIIYRGQWVELAEPVTGTVKTSSTNNAVVVLGKACNTCTASGTVYVLIYGPSLCVADESSMCSAGDGIGVSAAATQLTDDTGAGAIAGQFVAKALEDSGTDLDMSIVMIQPMGGTDGA